MIRKKHIASGILFFFLLLSSLSAETGDTGNERVVFLPVNELEEVLSSWWTQAGFEVQPVDSGKGVFELIVTKGKAACRFDLSPRSALATRIQTSPANGTVEISEELDSWWRYLEVYINAPAAETSSADPTIPVPVLSKIESVVCIRTISGEEKEQFSGVIVDKAGLVLSIAHGLLENEDIVVTLYDGKELRGVLIRQDIVQDLALIQISETAFQSVSLTNGRNLLGMGEKIFFIGCVGNLQGTVTTGMINAPPRRGDGQPLWQAHMEIHPGNSGSPVFDKEGALVALVKGRYRGTSSVGFLIPLETIIHFLKESSPS